jgi:flagellar biosynthetic protein FliQ
VLFRSIAISLLQITTSIQDAAFSTVPRLAAFLAGLLILMPWMFEHMASYAASILGNLGRYAR